MNEKWTKWAALSLLGWYFKDLLTSSVKEGVDVVTDLIGSGRRLTYSTQSLGPDEEHPDRLPQGVVEQDPDDLLIDACGIVGREISPDAYALARMVRSEAGSAGKLTKVRLANVAMNQARALGWSVYNVVVYHKTATRDGRYGAQISGRFASSRDPYESDLLAAEEALQGDITGGATNFAHQSAFGKQLGTASNIQPFVDTLASEGKVPGFYAPDSNLIFFWRGSVPDGVKEGLG